MESQCRFYFIQVPRFQLSEELRWKPWRIKNIEAPKFDKIVAVNASETDVPGMIKGKMKLGNYEAKVKLNILPDASYQSVGQRFYE